MLEPPDDFQEWEDDEELLEYFKTVDWDELAKIEGY